MPAKKVSIHKNMATDLNTIKRMQQDLLTYRSGKLGTSAAPETPAAPVAPAEPIAPTGATGSTGPAPVSNSIASDLDSYRKERDSGTLPTAVPKDNPSALKEFAKSIFTAPATLIARPFQAGAELLGADADAVDAATKKVPLFGSLVAPVPRNAGDVEKDVGRAAQTVALGTGAPIAGGALFGAGASLEQGNDLLSVKTALNAALGAGGGKILEWIGKPILNAAGKVVGTVTPQILKDVASGGADAIAKFAAEHELPFSSVVKPVAGAIEKSTQAVDEAIGSGFKKGGAALKDVASDQFPQLNPVEHYKNINARDIAKPTEVNAPAYSKATAVYNDAKGRGIDLEKVANDRGIIHDQIAEGGKYNTKDAVENLRDNNYKMSDTLARPAIRAADPGVRNLTIDEVREAMLKKINDIPASQIDDAERATMAKQIEKRYAKGGAADLAHPEGYSLESLHDSRISSAKNGGFQVGRSNSDTTIANRFRHEGQVFANLFDQNMPAEAGLQGFRKELEKNFMLADYLDQLHGKKVPEGVTKKAVKLFGRAIGGTLGGQVGGFPGFLAGSQFGNILFGGFETLPNPIKMKVLQSIVQDEPAAFQALRKYISDEDLKSLLRKALPAAGKSSYKEVAPTLFATPRGKITPNSQEAIDLTSVEQGKAKSPKDGRSPSAKRKLIDYVQENGEGPYVPAKDLPTIDVGKKKKSPKNLNDIL